MTAPAILALDMSLTATGWAVASASGVLKPPKSANAGVDRLRWIRDQLLAILEAHAPALVAIEGYAFGVQGQQGHISLGELGGVVRCALADRGVPFVEVNISSVKLFATGKGNAKKDEVFAAAIKKLRYDGTDHNEADALWIRALVTAAYAGADLTEYERRAVGKVDWPAL